MTDGCVFPTSVASLPTQLEAKGLTWKGYMEDMGTPCRHPAVGAVDDTQKAKIGDEYAARHNPFIYFSAITGSPSCAQHDVDLSQPDKDLASTSATPNLSYITANLCHDGHDSPCVDSRSGGLASADAWLRTWMPKILSSPAFGADGKLIITADEADSPQSTPPPAAGRAPDPTRRCLASPGPAAVGSAPSSCPGGPPRTPGAPPPTTTTPCWPPSRTSSGCPTSATPPPPGSTASGSTPTTSPGSSERTRTPNRSPAIGP